PSADAVLNNPTGVKSLGVGLQAEYSNQVGWVITSVGLVADEIGAGTAAFANYQKADAGDVLDLPTTGIANDPWTGMYRVITLSNELLAAIPNVEFQPGTASGLTALAKFYQGLAIGNLAMLYEQFPIETGLSNPEAPFVTREAGLARALQLLNEARDALIATPASAEFNSDVRAAGFDLENSIEAMIARFALIAGDLTQASTAAGRVSPGATSEFRFSAADGNPIFNIMYRSGDRVAVGPGADVPAGGGAGRRARRILRHRGERAGLRCTDGFAGELQPDREPADPGVHVRRDPADPGRGLRTQRPARPGQGPHQRGADAVRATRHRPDGSDAVPRPDLGRDTSDPAGRAGRDLPAASLRAVPVGTQVRGPASLRSAAQVRVAADPDERVPAQ